MKTAQEALDFVKRHGIVLEAGRGPVPNLAEAIAEKPIRGSWWGHPQGKLIFRLTRAVRESSDVLVCRVVDGKITYVHRRIWPALVRLAPLLEKERLSALHEVHTASGKHRIFTTPYPEWVPREVSAAAQKVSTDEALRQLGDWVQIERPAGR